MNFNDKLLSIKKSASKISVKHRRRLFAVIISGAVMMLLLLLVDMYIADIAYGVRDFVFVTLDIPVTEEYIELNEVVLLAVQMVIYIFTTLLPVVIPAAIYLKKSPVKYRGNRGVVGYIPFVIGAGYITSIAANIIFSGAGERFANGILDSVPSSISGVILYMIYLSLMPAILEELAFRGVMLRILSPYGKWQAIIISAFVFGSMHINPSQAMFAFAFGIMAGWLYTETGTLLWGMLVHLTVNGISGISSIVLSRYAEDSPLNMLIGLIIISLIVYALVYGIVMLVKRGGGKNVFAVGNVCDVCERTPLNSVSQLFKGVCVPATAVFAALYITLLLERYYPEIVGALLSIMQ